MKLLILEYVTAGGLGDPVGSPLLEEADAMALALARDFSELSEYAVSLLRYPHLMPPTLKSIHILPSKGLVSEWEQALSSHDQVIILAPETDSVLLDWCARVDKTGMRRLGTSLPALTIASDKSQTAQRLQHHSIAHVPTYRLDTTVPWHDHDGAWVLKPRDGCGCDGVQRFISSELAQQAITSLPFKHLSNWIVQPWLQGQAASLTLLGSSTGAQLLSINEQVLNISEEGYVHLEKVMTGSIKQDFSRFENLAQSVHEAIPGLHGIYGIDFLIQDQQLTVVEINPRVTSAYPGLRAVLGINPATLWIQSLGLSEQTYSPSF
jgi:predicted ATP-grasp superfamily ATP-dependent carboligase